MNNRKTYLFIICSLIITAGFACNRVVDPSADKSKLEKLQSQYSEIGNQHNASLDYVLNGFNNLSQKGRHMTQTEIMDFALHQNRQYVLSLYDSAELQKVVNKAFNNEINRMFSVSSDRSMLTGLNPDDSYIQRLKDPSVQSAEKKYFERISKLLETSDSHQEVKEKIKNILEEAEAELGEDKLKAVVLSAEVAIASSEYWIENREQWVEQLEKLSGDSTNAQDITPPSIEYLPWRNIAKSDVQGAITGAMGSVITGCGQLSMGVCTGAGALGGAAVGSVGHAVGAVIDEFFVNNPAEYPELEGSQ